MNAKAQDGAQDETQNATELRPLDEHLVVRRIKDSTMTEGGLVIPDSAQVKPARGIVVAAGPGFRDKSGTLHHLDVKAGDEVVFGKYAGTDIQIDGVEHVVLKEEDVIAWVRSEEWFRADQAEPAEDKSSGWADLVKKSNVGRLMNQSNK